MPDDVGYSAITSTGNGTRCLTSLYSSEEKKKFHIYLAVFLNSLQTSEQQ